MQTQIPTNAYSKSIEELIQHLKQLPAGTTFEWVEPVYHGGEVPENSLGTGYQLRVNICQGFNPPRSM
jgi:hypothetical protein